MQVGQDSKLMPADNPQVLSLSLIYRDLLPLSKHSALIKKNKIIPFLYCCLKYFVLHRHSVRKKPLKTVQLVTTFLVTSSFALSPFTVSSVILSHNESFSMFTYHLSPIQMTLCHCL